MSPDEAYVAGLRDIVDDVLFWLKDAHGMPRFALHEFIGKKLAALPPQAEKVATGGAPPLSPEGQDDHATLYAARIATETTIGDLARDAEIRTPDVSDVEFSRQPLDSLVGVRYLNALGRRLARVVYRASEEAGPSRGADAPLAPEGLSDLRWEVVETPCHPCAWKLVLRGSREDNGPSNYYDTYEGAAGAARRRNAALAATPAGPVAKIDGASAPSLPEGFATPQEEIDGLRRLVADLNAELSHARNETRAAQAAHRSAHGQWAAERITPGPTASVEAGPSRGAPAPLAPEGMEPMSQTVQPIGLKERNQAVRWAMRMRLDGATYATEMVLSYELTLRSAEVRLINEEIRRYDAQAQARTPSAASAASAPEGQSPAHEMGYALTCAERERDNLRESWIAARHVVFAAREVVACSEPLPGSAHAKLRDVVTAYDQRNHDRAGVATSDGANAPSLPEGISAPAIERYELDHGSGYDPLASMEPTGSAFDGDWVRYEDHVAALARAERAEKEIDAAAEVRAAILRDHERMKQCAEAAQAERDRMRAALTRISEYIAPMRHLVFVTDVMQMVKRANAPAPGGSSGSSDDRLGEAGKT